VFGSWGIRSSRDTAIAVDVSAAILAASLRFSHSLPMIMLSQLAMLLAVPLCGPRIRHFASRAAATMADLMRVVGVCSRPPSAQAPLAAICPLSLPMEAGDVPDAS